MWNWLSYSFALWPFLLCCLTAIDKYFRVERLIDVAKFVMLMAILTGLVGLSILISNDSVFTIQNTGLLGVQTDRISALFFTMVSVIGWVVLSFSKNYLRGDAMHRRFTIHLIFTIASVMFLMTAGDIFTFLIAWILSSYELRKLISFYQDRKYAVLSGKKKKMMSIFSAGLLIIAFSMIFLFTVQIDLNSFFQMCSSGYVDQSILEWIAVLLALAAIIQSAHVPFHGWVLSVMEAPTPVSGILHAGLLNAGPFLIIRFHPVFDKVSIAPNILILWGGLSAMYGTLVSFYQPAVKTRLSYSSVGHMGFSTMLSGLGLYPAAVLHLVGHSFYKAHTFLSSGSEIDKYRIIQTRDIHFAKLSKYHIIGGFAVGIALFLLLSGLFKGSFFPYYPFFILGFIITIGISAFIINTSVYTFHIKGFYQIISFTLFVFFSFFMFEAAAEFIIPVTPRNFEGNIRLFVSTTFIMIMFILLALYSVLLKWRYLPSIPKWDVYIRNGFYIHTWVDQHAYTINF